MSSTARRITRAGVIACGLTLATLTAPVALDAQNARPAPPQKIDAEYTAKIKEYVTDPRISTELVDHLPASDSVPTPLKFHGRIVGHARRADLLRKTSIAISRRSTRPRIAR